MIPFFIVFVLILICCCACMRACVRVNDMYVPLCVRQFRLLYATSSCHETEGEGSQAFLDPFSLASMQGSAWDGAARKYRLAANE